MIIRIDTETREVTFEDNSIKPKTTLADIISNYIGTKEYEGIVDTIQKWYYGKTYMFPWCATLISYFANQLGILPQVGKNENVYLMMCDCQKYANANKEAKFFDKMYIPNKILKGDILFYLWEGSKMGISSSKHVSVAYVDTISDTILSIGGNQDDEICIKGYPRSKLYAVYRPCYKY